MTSLSCDLGSLCFEMAKGFPAAFVALVIGVIATYIAWRQYETARAKIKLDLFEKRYAIFEKTWAFLSEAVQTGPGNSPLSSFDNVIPQSGFLFGSEIEAYLRNASSKQRELWSIHSKMKANGSVIAPEDVEKNLELMEWFYAEASEGAKKVFSPYLDFERWK